MTARRLLLATAVAALGWLLTACLPAVKMHTFPGGVTFGGLAQGRFRDVSWSQTPGMTCPLTLHLPGGPLGPEVLTDANALGTLGWVRHGHPDGGAHMRLEADDLGVDCSFDPAGGCKGVHLWLRADRWSSTAVVELNGASVALPATADDLSAALGPPVARFDP